jgi:GAF domain-containing protein
MDVQIALQELAQGFSTAAIGKEFFRTLAQYLSKALKVDYVFIGELTQENRNVKSVAFYANGHLVENTEYPLVGSLCELVVKPEFCAFTQNVQQLFPENEALKQLGVDSYVGIPLFNSAEKVLGLIYVMHSGPITDLAQTESLLTIAARRAELELEREQQARELKQANQRLQLELAERLRAESQLRQANQELLQT